jgi:hypothetical protein
MSLLPAFSAARQRTDDTSLRIVAGPAANSHAGDTPTTEDDIFDLLPPGGTEAAALDSRPEPKPQGRNRRPVDMTDLSRLSIDQVGRLYCDGKPVEVHHRITMSRGQIVGASMVAAFVVIAAALQGSVAARDWACRLGWSAGACALPAQPQNRPNIPT